MNESAEISFRTGRGSLARIRRTKGASAALRPESLSRVRLR